MNGTARFFTLSLIIEGATEKVLLTIHGVVEVNLQDLCFNELRVLFENCRKDPTGNNI